MCVVSVVCVGVCSMCGCVCVRVVSVVCAGVYGCVWACVW